MNNPLSREHVSVVLNAVEAYGAARPEVSSIDTDQGEVILNFTDGSSLRVDVQYRVPGD